MNETILIQQQIGELFDQSYGGNSHRIDAIWTLCEKGETALSQITPATRDIRYCLAQIAYLRGHVFYLSRGLFDEAIRYFDKSRQLFEEIGDAHAEVKGCLAQINYIKGYISLVDESILDEAITYFDESRQLFQEIEDIGYQIKALEKLGTCYHYLGVSPIAENYLSEALKLALEVDDKVNIAGIYYTFGEVYTAQQAYEQGYQNMLKALSLVREVNNTLLECFILGELGNALGYLNRAEEGIEWVQKAIIKSKTHGYWRVLFYSRYYLTSLYHQAGQYEAALALSEKLLPNIDQHSLIAIDFLAVVAELYIDLQKYDEALAMLAKAEKDAEDKGIQIYKQRLYQVYARVHEALGNYGETLAMMKRHVEAIENIRRPETQAAIRAVELYHARKKAEQAAEIQRLHNIELRKKNEQLAVLNSEKDEILGIVAHDLRNPLAGIKLTNDILRNHYVRISPGKRIEQLQRIDKTAVAMTETVNTLLEMQKAEEPLDDINIRETAVCPLIETVIRQIHLQATGKQIAILTDFVATDGVALADPSLLKRVLENLLSNAIKYSPNETAVTINVTTTSTHVIISCADQGLGLSESDMEKMFGKFARLSAQPTGGERATGLGLFIVKKLTEAMNGTIRVESPGKNQGSTFTVLLPRILQDLLI